MTTKKILLLIFGGISAAVLLFILLLYLTLRTKTNDVSKEPPFSNFVSQQVILGNDAVLVNNDPAFVYEEPLLLNAVGEQLFEGVTVAHHLKKGDVLLIKKVVDFTNGVSGSTHTIVFGEVVRTSGSSQSLSFEYYWDTQEIKDNGTGKFTFSFAIPAWQEGPVEQKEVIK